MNQIPQLDLHPGAEALSAFAEQALPEAERAQVLDHVAGCSRCRQIVYLAQEAADELEAPAWTPTARPARAPFAWLGNWRAVWVPAAGFAALVTVAIVLHYRPAPQNAEIAKATPQELDAVARSPLQPPAGADKPHAAPPSTAANQALAKTKPEISPASADTAPAPAPPASPSANTGTFKLSSAQPESASEPLGSAGQAYGAQAAPPQGSPQTAVAAWQQEQQRAVEAIQSRAAAAAKATQLTMRNAADRMMAGRAPSSSAAGGQMQPNGAPSGSFDSAALARSGAAVERKALPSGLTPVSTAAAQRHLLAIDQNGALFLSEDAGKSWAAVPRQWTGKATQLRLRRTGSGNGTLAVPAGANPSHGAVDAISAPGPLFEMTNDAGLAWVSADGRTWRQQ